MSCPDCGRCIFCGAPAVHGHHPTAGLEGGVRHLDPAFKVDVCRSCHYAEHAVWNDVGLDVIVDPVMARLRRLIWFVGRLAELDHPVSFTSEVLVGLHCCLLALMADLAERVR